MPRPKAKPLPLNRYTQARHQKQADKLGITLVEYLERGKKERYCSCCGEWKPPSSFYRKVAFITAICRSCTRLQRNSQEIIYSVPTSAWSSYCSAAKKLGISIKEYTEHKDQGESFCQICRNWFLLLEVQRERPAELRPQVCMSCWNSRPYHLNQNRVT